MASVSRDSLTRRVFTDAKNYPYGFSRSGDFSINESKALSQHGALFAALVDGVVAPESEEDQHFLAAAFGQAEPESLPERAWLKYQRRINRPKLASIYGNKPSRMSDDDDSMDDGVELELDVDSD